MKGFITAAEAAKLIKDGDTVASCGMAFMGVCEEVIRSTEARFLQEGHPRDLTVMICAHQGDKPSHNQGHNRWGHEGLIKCWIGSLIGTAPDLARLVNENKIEAYCFPFGTITQMYVERAGGRPGLLSKTGLKTYCDPRVEGGRLNAKSTQEMVKLVEIDGEEYLFYKAPKVDVCIFRGTTADENGNITISEESMNSEALAAATACRNSGGTVIAQVKYRAAAGTLHPRDVHVPGVLVDYVVLAETPEETHAQNEEYFYHPGLAGNIKVPLAAMKKAPLDTSKVIARRAAMELNKGDCANLGIGIPQVAASVVAEEGCADYMKLTSESGTIGGIALAGGPGFGNAWNVECFLDPNEQFCWYDGGGLDITCLGLAETDVDGNVNVSKFGGIPQGPGGLSNIAGSTKKVVFCGTFMAKAKVAVEDGKIKIVQEGSKRKFLNAVEQITFSGEYAAESGQSVKYITERGVFVLTPEHHLKLVEIAPGIDLEKDILANMEFKPEIADDLKLMDEALFREEWGGLKVYLDSK